MPHQHMHTRSKLEKKEMGEKKHQGRNWSFGYGGHEGYGNQNPRLNPRDGGPGADWTGNGGGLDHGGDNTSGNSATTTNGASNGRPTANLPANSPGTTQGRPIYPTQATNIQGDNGEGTRTLPTQPDRGHPVHTGLRTSIISPPGSVTVVVGGQTTFVADYSGGDTLAVDTQAFSFSAGPRPTSGADGSNNFNPGSNGQTVGPNGAASNKDSNGGLGDGAIAGIIVGVVLLVVISIVFLFFRKRKNSRLDNSPYGKHHPEETRSSILDTGLAASAAAGAAAVGARAGHGHGAHADISSTTALQNNTPAQLSQGQQQPLMQQTNSSNPQFHVSAGSRHMDLHPAPSPPSAPPQSNHSSNPSRGKNRLSVSIISPPPTHISSALIPTAVSPISPVSPAVLAPPSPPSPDNGENGGGGLGRRSSIGSVSTLSIHSAMMTASQLNWPMPPSVASTSSPSVPLSATPSATPKPPMPSPHYVDFEEQGRTVVRINRESLGGAGGGGGIGSVR